MSLALADSEASWNDLRADAKKCSASLLEARAFADGLFTKLMWVREARIAINS